MTQEFTPTVREDPPEGMEYKSTTDTLIGYNPARVPHSSRSGAAVTDEERADAEVFPGTFAAGNGVQNSNVRTSDGGGARDGLATDSGGTRRSGRGVTGKSTAARTGAGGGRSDATKSASGGAPAGSGAGGSGSTESPGGQANG